jgi:type IV pilus assembly protein PilX
MKSSLSINLQQRGAALVVSLLLLLVMTLIGITAMQGTAFEERIAGNMRDRSLAFQASESALRAGEVTLSQPVPPVFGCGSNSDGLFVEGTCTPSGISADSFWSGTDKLAVTGTDLTGTGTSRRLSANPQYILEKLTTVSSAGSLETGVVVDTGYYRITAKGTGGTSTAVAVVQSVFKP